MGAANELADFDPESGHLHACLGDPGCDCAAFLFCVAQDLQGEVRRLNLLRIEHGYLDPG